VELPQRLIELYTYEGDLVLDPFMGAGTTLVAAARTGRRYVGYDTEPEYVERARARVAAEQERQQPPRQLSLSARDGEERPAQGSLEETEHFQAVAVERGKKAQALAEAALERAGFVIQARKKRLRGLGLAVDLVVEDQTGGTWHVDVSGSFTVAPATGTGAGLVRIDTVWKALGRAHVLARHRGPDGPPLLLLTSHLPPRRSPAVQALRAAGPEAFFDALTILDPADEEVLGRYAAAGAGDGPHPDGFWSEVEPGGRLRR